MRADHIHHRIDMQASTRSQIETAYENLMKVGRNKITSTRINTRIDAVREYWHQFTTNDCAIKQALLRVDLQAREEIYKRSYFVSDHFKRTNEIYLDVIEKMKDLLREDYSSSPLTASSSTQYKPSASSTIPPSYQPHRLPRIDLPKFNGTLTDWLSFKGLFVSLVQSNSSISAVEKLQYLKTSLIGPAAFLLKNTDLTAENFQRAWDAVISFYENERRLVNAALKSLFALKKMTKDSASELEHLYMSFGQVYRTLESLNRPVNQCDDFLVFMMIQRLDPESIKAWELHLGASKSTPTWVQLKEFIESRLLSLQSFESSQVSLHQRHSSKFVTPHARTHFMSSSISCPICSSRHHLYQCESFKNKTTAQRREFVASKGFCFNCLNAHKVMQCKSGRRCQKCGKKHHTLLHIQPQNPLPKPPEKQANHVHQLSLKPTTVLLATLKVSIQGRNGEREIIWALLDQGSEISLVSERIVQKLQLPRSRSSVTITGVGANRIGKTKGIANIIIRPHFDAPTMLELKACILPKLTTSLPSTQYPYSDSWNHLRNLKLADPEFNCRKQIDLIIGADYYGQLLEGSVIKGPINSPVAQYTKFGWVISGPVNSNNTRTASVFHCSIDNDLNNILEKFWIQEEVSIRKPSLSSDDQSCESHFNTTHSRDSNGRYIVRLPFKLPTNLLGNSYIPAQQALRHQCNKFQKDPKYYESYSKFMEEYKELKHMVKVPTSSHDQKSVFYSPHHGVVRKTSSTTKLLVVINGSCRAPGGKSLNDILHTGAK